MVSREWLLVSSPPPKHTHAHTHTHIHCDTIPLYKIIGYGDVAGLEGTVALLRQVIQLPLEQPHVFAEKGIHLLKAVVLHGPPGTGKSLLGQAVSGEVKAATFHIDASVAFGR